MFENGIDHLVTMPANVMISFPSLLDSPLVVVTIHFPYRSILLITHSCHLLTWRGRDSAHFLNTIYLLVHSSSTFSLVSPSLDTLIS